METGESLLVIAARSLKNLRPFPGTFHDRSGYRSIVTMVTNPSTYMDV